MSTSEHSADLTIRDVVRLTGVSESTLRMWEHRHGAPAPARLPSGHRRYSTEDVELVRRISEERAEGLPMGAAIERARARTEPRPSSLFAGLRASRPDIEARTLTKPRLLALTRAIEDECLSRAERPLLFASFQRERFYRQSEPRWRGFSRTAALAVVMADFPRRRAPRRAPIELPIAPEDPLLSEWAIVCDAERHGACLAAWEHPPAGAGAPRRFETIWSVEPAVVREAAGIFAAIAGAISPDVLTAARSRLEAPSRPTAEAQLKLASAVLNRTLSYLS